MKGYEVFPVDNGLAQNAAKLVTLVKGVCLGDTSFENVWFEYFFHKY